MWPKEKKVIVRKNFELVEDSRGDEPSRTEYETDESGLRLKGDQRNEGKLKRRGD